MAAAVVVVQVQLAAQVQLPEQTAELESSAVLVELQPDTLAVVRQVEIVDRALLPVEED